MKIRGYRIELAEIETCLSLHSAVREVAVLLREDNPGDKRLVAYLTTAQGAAPSAEILRTFLKEKLPEHMIPSGFVLLDEMPLTTNGKLDRRALPAPEALEAEQSHARARNPIEEMIAGVWKEVLGLKQVAINENFFDLGGHSLLATRLISRLRQVFNVDLTLPLLFEAPTVEGLAEEIESLMRAGHGTSLPAITQVSREQAMPLSFAQQRLWFLSQLEPESAQYNIAAPARLKGALDLAALRKSLSEIIKRHEILRTTFIESGQDLIQVIAPPQAVRLPEIDLSELLPGQREAEAGWLAEREALFPFSLSRGPLLRASLVKLSETEHVILFTMHHIASDGWSMNILIREVSLLYRAFSQGKPSPLTDLEIQYADYAYWQRKWLRGEVLEEHLAYWKRQLGGGLPVLQLASNKTRTAAIDQWAGTEAFSIPQGLSEQLRALSRSQGVTLFMTLLAAFKVLLYRYTGQDDVIVGTAVANRNRAETEGLIGFFINMLVIRTDLSGDPTFREVLARVRKVSLEAYLHQDVPFEKIVEDLRPDREGGAAPLFQVAFGLDNSPAESADVSDLSLQPFRVNREVARYDLTLWMMESAGSLRGVWTYKKALFDAEKVKRLSDHFNTLLQSMAANPESELDA
ncbi:MAG TPA: condensation domain-containing protein, partial [Blastocatellia bacterium]